MKCIKFNKNYPKIKNFYFIRGLHEIKKLEPKMLLFTFFYGLVSSICPFVSIYGISIIVDDLVSKDEIVYKHIIVLIIINSLIYTLNSILHKCFFMEEEFYL